MTATNPLSYLSEQLEAWRQAGTYQRLRVLESPCEPVSRVDGREVINLASNNYLGLADHPKLVEAAFAAAVSRCAKTWILALESRQPSIMLA